MDGRYAQNYQKINSKNYKNRRYAKPLIIFLFHFFIILRPIGRPHIAWLSSYRKDSKSFGKRSKSIEKNKKKQSILIIIDGIKRLFQRLIDSKVKHWVDICYIRLPDGISLQRMCQVTQADPPGILSFRCNLEQDINLLTFHFVRSIIHNHIAHHPRWTVGDDMCGYFEQSLCLFNYQSSFFNHQ